METFTMTGFDSKRKIAQDRLDDDDVQVYAKPRLDQGPDYDRGFVDGMLHQTQSSVDKAVNRMAHPAQEPVDNDFFKVLSRNNPSPDQRPTCTIIHPPKPVGHWVLYPQATPYTSFAMYHKPTDKQIKNTEQLLGWEWRDA